MQTWPIRKLFPGAQHGQSVKRQHSASPWLSLLVQDLELWLSREVVPDGHLLVTRAGKTVQELQIKTSLSASEMKSAVQRVLRRLV